MYALSPMMLPLYTAADDLRKLRVGAWEAAFEDRPRWPRGPLRKLPLPPLHWIVGETAARAAHGRWRNAT